MLLKEFAPIIKKTQKDLHPTPPYSDKDVEELIDKFIDSYINNPPEYIGSDIRDLDYN